jgi:hypothetical protein
MTIFFVGIAELWNIVHKNWHFCKCLMIIPVCKTDRHNITEILLKVVLNTIKQTMVNMKIFKIERHHTVITTTDLLAIVELCDFVQS